MKLSLRQSGVHVLDRCVCAFLTTVGYAVSFIPIPVEVTLLFPSFTLAAKLLLDPTNYPMAIFISEILSTGFSILLFTFV